jgi:uncharacterized integral membrane protein
MFPVIKLKRQKELLKMIFFANAEEIKMKISYHHLRWQRPLIVLLIFAHLVGCSKWSVMKQPMKRDIVESQPKLVEIKLYSGEKCLMKNAYVEGDYLYGIKVRKNPIAYGNIEEKYYVHLKEIKQVAEKKTDVGSIIGLTFIGTLIVGGVIAYSVYNSIDVPDFSGMEVSY